LALESTLQNALTCPKDIAKVASICCLPLELGCGVL
jgi:hypothetical protein